MSDEGVSPLYRRRLRVQLIRAAATGEFEIPVSRVPCGVMGCRGVAWRPGTRYCRACWLRVVGQDALPHDRD